MRKEIDIKDRILSDQTAYEKNSSKETVCPACKNTSNLSKRQNNSLANRTTPSFQMEDIPEDNSTYRQRKIRIVFNNFFSKVVIDNRQKQQKQTYPKSKLNYFTVSEKEIEETLRGLQINKACGPDDIGNIILKNTPALAKSPKLVFQTSLNTGKIQTIWKISEIISIYTKKDRADILQYCPINLLKNVFKVFDRILFA